MPCLSYLFHQSLTYLFYRNNESLSVTNLQIDKYQQRSCLINSQMNYQLIKCTNKNCIMQNRRLICVITSQKKKNKYLYRTTFCGLFFLFEINSVFHHCSVELKDRHKSILDKNNRGSIQQSVMLCCNLFISDSTQSSQLLIYYWSLLDTVGSRG